MKESDCALIGEAIHSNTSSSLTAVFAGLQTSSRFTKTNPGAETELHENVVQVIQKSFPLPDDPPDFLLDLGDVEIDSIYSLHSIYMAIDGIDEATIQEQLAWRVLKSFFVYQSSIRDPVAYFEHYSLVDGALVGSGARNSTITAASIYLLREFLDLLDTHEDPSNDPFSTAAYNVRNADASPYLATQLNGEYDLSETPYVSDPKDVVDMDKSGSSRGANYFTILDDGTVVYDFASFDYYGDPLVSNSAAYALNVPRDPVKAYQHYVDGSTQLSPMHYPGGHMGWDLSTNIYAPYIGPTIFSSEYSITLTDGFFETEFYTDGELIGAPLSLTSIGNLGWSQHTSWYSEWTVFHNVNPFLVDDHDGTYYGLLMSSFSPNNDKPEVHSFKVRTDIRKFAEAPFRISDGASITQEELGIDWSPEMSLLKNANNDVYGFQILLPQIHKQGTIIFDDDVYLNVLIEQEADDFQISLQDNVLLMEGSLRASIDSSNVDGSADSSAANLAFTMYLSHEPGSESDKSKFDDVYAASIESWSATFPRIYVQTKSEYQDIVDSLGMSSAYTLSSNYRGSHGFRPSGFVSARTSHNTNGVYSLSNLLAIAAVSKFSPNIAHTAFQEYLDSMISESDSVRPFDAGMIPGALFAGGPEFKGDSPNSSEAYGSVPILGYLMDRLISLSTETTELSTADIVGTYGVYLLKNLNWWFENRLLNNMNIPTSGATINDLNDNPLIEESTRGVTLLLTMPDFSLCTEYLSEHNLLATDGSLIGSSCTEGVDSSGVCVVDAPWTLPDDVSCPNAEVSLAYLKSAIHETGSLFDPLGDSLDYFVRTKEFDSSVPDIYAFRNDSVAYLSPAVRIEILSYIYQSNKFATSFYTTMKEISPESEYVLMYEEMSEILIKVTSSIEEICSICMLDDNSLFTDYRITGSTNIVELPTIDVTEEDDDSLVGSPIVVAAIPSAVAVVVALTSTSVLDRIAGLFVDNGAAGGLDQVDMDNLDDDDLERDDLPDHCRGCCRCKARKKEGLKCDQLCNDCKGCKGCKDFVGSTFDTVLEVFSPI